MYNNKLSIIIPAFNTGQYLEQTLNIITNQSLKDCEIIVINDNSTDNTENIVKMFQKQFTNIKYIKNETNRGPGYSRNIGISVANGEFITFLDSDDWPDLFAYETASNILIDNPDCSFVIWGIKNEYNNRNSSYIRTDYKSYNVINKNIALSLLCNTHSLDTTISAYLGNKMFRVDYLKNYNISFENILFEDVAFSFESIIHAEKIILLPNIYTHYYQRQYSIVHSFTKKHISDMFKAFTYIRQVIDGEFEQYRKDFASLVEKCSKTLFALLFSNIENPVDQKEFLCFYFEQLLNFCSIEEIIDYVDYKRLKNILLNC